VTLTPIPISTVELGDDVEQLVLEVLRSGIIAQGPMVARLEQLFADVCGVRNVIAVNNGTTALVAALHVLDLRPGDEVITTPFTFVATVNAALFAGATVRFADICEDDFNIDPTLIEPLVNERTRALLPVHLYGQSADMAAITDIASRRDLALVEDAAQAHGATFDGRAVGTFGTGCFSLYATKNITTAEGGLITTDDDVVADRLQVLRNQGMRQRYVYEMAGNNYRLTDLHAAVGIPQLERIEQIIAARRNNAAILTEGLRGIPGLHVPTVIEGRGHVWHQYTIRLDDDAALTRDELAERLAAEGITTGVYYPKVAFDYDCYASHPGVIAADVPVARKVAASVLALPVHPKLTPDDIERIVTAIRKNLER
jgi:dTDP-4-amino-4,6-dideoxygalactose transaminase